MKPLLVIGIDPGTTVGYALLDVSGKLIKIESGKGLDIDTLVSKVIDIGIPLIVGCDKAKAPGFVDKFATKVGARLVWPNEDLLVEEKRSMARGHDCSNSHELDALACAFFAYKHVEGLFRRIDKFLEGKKKTEFSDRIKELVVKKGIHMSGALDILVKPEQDDVRIIKKVIEEKQLDEKDFLQLYNELKKVEQDCSRLRHQNTLIQDQLQKIGRECDTLKKKAAIAPKTPADKKLRFKEDKIRFLGAEVSKKEKEIASLKKKINGAYALLAGISNKIVAKKLQNLGWNEYAAKKGLLKIRKGDILFVDDPNEFSDKTIGQLKGIVEIIIHKKEIGKKLEKLGFVFISAGLVEIEENEYFAFVNKGMFEEARRNRQLLRNIIEAYKQERAM